jgi:hypothetical protein
VENRLIFNEHPLEDEFEEYAFDRLSEERCAQFEEHLLVCERCQDQLAQTDEYILLMKQTAAQWRGASSGKAPRAGISPTVLWSSMAAVLAAGLVTAALTLGVPHTGLAREPSSVLLIAMRGGQEQGMPRARAGAPVDITIDTSDFDDRHHLRIKMVDADGLPVWNGQAIELAAGNRVSARIDARLAVGVYWIRLYSAEGELLREFGLRVE